MSDECCKCGTNKVLPDDGKYVEQNGKQGWLCSKCFWDWLDGIKRPRERELEAEVARLKADLEHERELTRQPDAEAHAKGEEIAKLKEQVNFATQKWHEAAEGKEVSP